MKVTDKTGKGIAQNIHVVLIQLTWNTLRFGFYDYANKTSGNFQKSQAMLSAQFGDHTPYISCRVRKLNTFVEHRCFQDNFYYQCVFMV